MTTPIDPAQSIIEASFARHASVLALCQQQLIPAIQRAGAIIQRAIHGGHKILFCGNGGSAADSQHIAAEFVGRYKAERRPLAAVALTTDTSILTAIGNDYSFDEIFSRQVRGIAQAGDVLVGITTSGNSRNVIAAVQCATEMGCDTIALVGRDGGALAPLCTQAIVVPADETSRIQEMHILIGHVLCEFLEQS